MAASFTKTAWFRALAAWAGTQYIRLCHATSRWEHINEAVVQPFWDEEKAFIGVIWHGRLMMARYGWRSDKPVSALISRHGDGELIARVLNNLGMQAIRGSSQDHKARERGGAAAVRAMTKVLSEGHSVGITPDGPKGPRMRAKEGAIALARMSGVPILPVTYSMNPRKTLNSWDSLVIARPFSRGVILWGNPIHVPGDASEEVMEQKRLEVEVELNRITDEADRMMGQTPIEPGKARFKKAAANPAPEKPEEDDVSNAS